MDDRIKVACVGDSITWGFTLPLPWLQSYPARLQKMLGWRYHVRNFGRNDASARYDADTPYVSGGAYRRSLAWNPDIVIIMLGSNDTKRRNWDPEVFGRDYRRLVASYRSLPSSPRVVLVAPIRIFLVAGVPLMGLHPDTMEEGVRPAIRGIAAEQGLQLVDLADLITDRRLCLDGVHPQLRGTAMMAEAIHRAVFAASTAPGADL